MAKAKLAPAFSDAMIHRLQGAMKMLPDLQIERDKAARSLRALRRAERALREIATSATSRRAYQAHAMTALKEIRRLKGEEKGR